MNNNNTERNKSEILELMCNMSGLTPKNLRTKIDVYSKDSSGKKIIIYKKSYSMEDLIDGIKSGIEIGMFYDTIA